MTYFSQVRGQLYDYSTAGQRPELGTFLPGGPVPERERRSEVRVKAEKCVYDVCGALGNSDEG